MIFKIIIAIVFFAYMVFNFITAKLKTSREMKNEFIEGQCAVGKVFANIFYAPAWLLKGIRCLVVSTVK